MRRWLGTGLSIEEHELVLRCAREYPLGVGDEHVGNASRIDYGHGVRIFSRQYGGTGAPPPWIEAAVESVEFGMHVRIPSDRDKAMAAESAAAATTAIAVRRLVPLLARPPAMHGEVLRRHILANLDLMLERILVCPYVCAALEPTFNDGVRMPHIWLQHRQAS